jgi:hypothetical protein
MLISIMIKRMKSNNISRGPERGAAAGLKSKMISGIPIPQFLRTACLPRRLLTIYVEHRDSSPHRVVYRTTFYSQRIENGV